MNCKQGDLAVIVRAPAYNPQALGLMVQVVEFAGYGLYASTVPGLGNHEPKWLVSASRPVRCAFGQDHRDFVVPDAVMRPIRPGDTEDETPAEIIESLTA